MILFTKGRNAAVIDRRRLTGQITGGPSEVSIVFRSCNIRIDNAPILSAELDLPIDTNVDGLLLAAWSRWRTDMADRLRGSFAFALFDGATGDVFCARDVFGLSPFYYAELDQKLYLGSSSKLVRSLLPGPPAENLTMLADFVCGVVLDKEQTFFEGISRLPPAHWLIVRKDEVVKTRYWSLSNVEPRRECPDAPKRFRELFGDAVANCYVENKTALMLSGGLDSSAIAGSIHAANDQCDALKSMVLTYYDDNNWYDRPHLAALYERFDITPIELASDNHDPLFNVEHWLETMDGPYLPHGHSVSFRLLPLTKDLGKSIALSGHGGDEVVSYGFGRLNEMARDGKWLRLWKECSAAAALYNDPHWLVFRKYLVHSPLFRLLRTLRGAVRFRRPTKTLADVTAPYLSPDLAKKIDLTRYAHVPAISRRDHDERMLQEDALTIPLQPLSLEVFALCSEASGVETRMPFYDRDLVEFSFSLPADWKLRNGLSRYILRKAFAGELPSDLLNRQDKFNFAENFKRGLISDPHKLLALTDPEKHEIARFVNIEKLATIRHNISRNAPGLEITDAFFIWRVAVLSMWLTMATKKLLKPGLERLSEG